MIRQQRSYNVRFIVSYIYFLIVLGIYIMILNTRGIYNSESFYISNTLIIVYSLINILIHENKAYSVKKFFHLFVFFFMGIAPLLQYKNGDQTVVGYDISEQTYIYTNYIVLMCSICFDIFYNVFYKSIRFRNFEYKFRLGITKRNEPKVWTRLLVTLSVFSCLYILYYYRNAPLLLVFRGIEGISVGTNQESGNYMAMITECVIRPLSVVCCINYLCIGKNKSIKIFLFLLSLITCFPLSIARLRVAAYYIPMLIIIFPKLRYNNKFVIVFIGGILLVFPFLNIFRNWGNSDMLSVTDTFAMFRSMNFDSYQSFAFVIQNDIITYGRQLLVALFFWVPRVFWPNKPFFSGHMVAHEYGLWFDQISMNYYAEGYLNAGLFGVLIFVIILAYCSAKFDVGYWKYNNGRTNTLYAPFFLIFASMLFFILRGDLMFAFEYTICLMLDCYIIFKITKKIYL